MLGFLVGLLFGYTLGMDIVTTWDCNTLTSPIAMFILYTVAPLLYRLASSAYFNLSLLSSDFYGLLFGTQLHFKFPANNYLIEITGLFLFVRYAPPLMQLSYTSLCSTSNHTGSTSLHSPWFYWD